MENWGELLLGLTLGLGLSACCGFRVFIPLLVAAVATKLHLLPVAANFSWLGSWLAIICFGTAAIAEVMAYYVPVVDHVLDVIAAPAAMIAGTVLSAATLVHLDPAWQWILALMVGGGSAGLIQAGTGLLRFGSAKTTAGLGNPVVATAENVAAGVGAIATLLAPAVMAIVVVLLLLLIIGGINRFFFKKKTTW
ncbi:MAG: DUF4126 domain-containing protein [Chitinophagales bacterium]